MREILFRGKLASSGEWVYGSYVHCPNPVCIGSSHPYCMWVPAANPDETTTVIEVDPETIGQFTGLTDKNGKRIFEGDIIQSTETKETAVVQWFPEHSAFMVWCKSSNEVGFLYECTKSIIEVIGNIHDNPEILKGGGNDG